MPATIAQSIPKLATEVPPIPAEPQNLPSPTMHRRCATCLDFTLTPHDRDTFRNHRVLNPLRVQRHWLSPRILRRTRSLHDGSRCRKTPHRGLTSMRRSCRSKDHARSGRETEPSSEILLCGFSDPLFFDAAFSSSILSQQIASTSACFPVHVPIVCDAPITALCVSTLPCASASKRVR